MLNQNISLANDYFLCELTCSTGTLRQSANKNFNMLSKCISERIKAMSPSLRFTPDRLLDIDQENQGNSRT